MATWQELSSDNFQAATKLLNEGHLRSSVSRAYYAAYCAVTAELVAQGVQFAHGWNNPAHDQLPELILNTMRLPRALRFPLNRAVRRLRTARENVDYRPHTPIDRPDAIRFLRDASFVLRELGVLNE